MGLASPASLTQLNDKLWKQQHPKTAFSIWEMTSNTNPCWLVRFEKNVFKCIGGQLKYFWKLIRQTKNFSAGNNDMMLPCDSSWIASFRMDFWILNAKWVRKITFSNHNNCFEANRKKKLSFRVKWLFSWLKYIHKSFVYRACRNSTENLTLWEQCVDF